jgi:hypothetical protein
VFFIGFLEAIIRRRKADAAIRGARVQPRSSGRFLLRRRSTSTTTFRGSSNRAQSRLGPSSRG